jgi:hypothetical protein
VNMVSMSEFLTSSSKSSYSYAFIFE